MNYNYKDDKVTFEAGTRLYIAYGSNLNKRQMKRRCPTAKPVGKAILKDHGLVFRGYGTGVANVEYKEGAYVPALVWEVTEKDEEALDKYEGYPKLYHKETNEVDLDGETTITAFFYIMNDGYPLSSPSSFYYDTIREGYRDCGFDLKILEEFVNDMNADRMDTDEKEALFQQIVSIRDSGETNMLDVRTVARIAMREGYDELLSFLEHKKEDYWNFIMSGNKTYLGLPDDGPVTPGREEEDYE